MNTTSMHTNTHVHSYAFFKIQLRFASYGRVVESLTMQCAPLGSEYNDDDDDDGDNGFGGGSNGGDGGVGGGGGCGVEPDFHHADALERDIPRARHRGATQMRFVGLDAGCKYAFRLVAVASNGGGGGGGGGFGGGVGEEIEGGCSAVVRTLPRIVVVDDGDGVFVEDNIDADDQDEDEDESEDKSEDEDVVVRPATPEASIGGVGADRVALTFAPLVSAITILKCTHTYLHVVHTYHQIAPTVSRLLLHLW
jgi:hypothetical protein